MKMGRGKTGCLEAALQVPGPLLFPLFQTLVHCREAEIAERGPDSWSTVPDHFV